MKVLVTSIPVDQFYTEPIGLVVFTDIFPPHRETGRVDFRLSGIISRWIREGIVDPASPETVPFAPGSGAVFPALVVRGAGAFLDLSDLAVEDAIAGMTETLIATERPSFSIAARDLRLPNVAARQSAEAILNGLARAAKNAGISSGRTIRLHWDEDEADLLVQELRRLRRRLLRICRDWEVEREPMDLEV